MSRFVFPVRLFVARPRLAALISAGIVSAGLVATYALAQAHAPEMAEAQMPVPPAPRVTVSAVEQRVVTEFEEITGRVEAAETVELRARVSGHLESVNFQAGQLVKKGDILFTIDPRWHRAQFELARAQVEQASAQADVAGREARRATQLLEAAAVSSEEAEARRSRQSVMPSCMRTSTKPSC